MPDEAISLTVGKYVAAWNEPDAAKRARLLEESWDDGGVYVDPTVRLAGRAALDAHIARMLPARPGSRIVLRSPVDAHHGVFRFHWQMIRADGTAGALSIDFGEVAEDGRIAKIVGFFGPLPDRGEGA